MWFWFTLYYVLCANRYADVAVERVEFATRDANGTVSSPFAIARSLPFTALFTTDVAMTDT